MTMELTDSWVEELHENWEESGLLGMFSLNGGHSAQNGRVNVVN